MNARPAKYSPFRSFGSFGLTNWTIGAKAANTINAALTLKDAKGKPVIGNVSLRCWLSDSPTGAGITATVPTSTVVVHTNGTIISPLVANKLLQVLTDSQGRIDLDIIQTASPVTYYLVVEHPSGFITVSPAITF